MTFKRISLKPLIIVSVLFLIFAFNSAHAAKRDDGIYELTESELKASYEKYIVPNLSDKVTAGPLSFDLSDECDSEGHFTESSKQKMLDMLNFIRSIYGLNSVKWNADNAYYAQAGVQYLADNHLSISHTAASGKDEIAHIGLSRSSLAQAWSAFSIYSHLFSWLTDIDVDSLGHRMSILSPHNSSVGMAMAIDRTRPVVYTAHFSETNNYSDDAVITYPNAGLAPINTFQGFYRSNALWSISLGKSYSANPDKIAVTITDDTGKKIKYVKGNVDSTKNENTFSVSGSLIRINPYAFTQDDTENLLNHSYTIEVTGLDGKQNSLKYTTKVISLDAYKPDNVGESSCKELSFSKSEITVGSWESKTLNLNIEPAEEIKNVIVRSSNSDIASLKVNKETKQVTIYGIEIGDAIVSVVSQDEKKIANCLVHVVAETPEEDPSIDNSESDCTELAFLETEITVGTGQSKTVKFKIEPAEQINHIILGSSSYSTAYFSLDKEAKQLTIYGREIGDATITITSQDQKRTTKCLVHVVDKVQDEPAQSNPPVNTPSTSGSIPIYRLHNPATGEHLYTSDKHESDVLSVGGWDYEGIGWQAPQNGQSVYRLYSPVTRVHLFTTDVNEVQTLSSQGWSIDNNGAPLFYSGGTRSVYRLYNPVSRMHLITLDLNEYTILGNQGWNQEGEKLKAY